MVRPAEILETGLSEAAAAASLKRHGYNELPATRQRSVPAITLDVLREPMFLLLLAAGAVYLVLGDLAEALMLLSFAVINIATVVFQERKTERVLEALRDLTSPRALVIRDGIQRRIAGREVVPGDLIVLSEGDRIPADATLVSCHDLQADESLLTGEAVPVRKSVGEAVLAAPRPGGDDLPFVWSGSMVVKGQGIALVTATGAETAIGRIGQALGQQVVERAPLERQTAQLVRLFAIGGLALSLLVVALYWLVRGDWFDGLLAGITLAMSMLPQEFPVVLAVFLALGAWRLSKSRVLTRRATAIETLGAVTVLCVDKTGTLTRNRMAVAALDAGGEVVRVAAAGDTPLPESCHDLVEYAILASETDPFDPMEKAFHDLGRRTLGDTRHLHPDWTLVQEYELGQGVLAMSHGWKAPDREDHVVAAKGAPEAVFDLCYLPAAERQVLAARVGSLAAQGLRVLGVAKAIHDGPGWPASQHDFVFAFVGLIGLSDPVRSEVPAAVQECHAAGIRVVMITGDYPTTARAIAAQAGLDTAGDIVTGEDLDRLDEAELARRVRTASIFARVMPEQKLRLVNAFKTAGEVVAMTGDGVNDAPALKSAHIGIAMGGRGTDVAREAAALVLLDDDFGSIVRAVALGRCIYDNLRKAMAFIMAVHVPIAGLALLPLMLGLPLMLFPVHIVFLELVIDPVISMVFETEPAERDAMRRPPRDPAAPLFGGATVALSLLQGAGVLLLALGLFAGSLALGRSETEARSLTFVALVVASFALILTNRSWSQSMLATLATRNVPLWIVAATVTAILAVILTVPFAWQLFRFAPLQPADLLVAAATGFAAVLWFEAYKRLNRD